MALTDQIAADQQAVIDAQRALVAVQEKLVEHQAQLDALAPHAGVLADIEAVGARTSGEVFAELKDLTAKLKALLGL